MQILIILVVLGVLILIPAAIIGFAVKLANKDEKKSIDNMPAPRSHIS